MKSNSTITSFSDSLQFFYKKLAYKVIVIFMSSLRKNINLKNYSHKHLIVLKDSFFSNINIIINHSLNNQRQSRQFFLNSRDNLAERL